MSLNVTQQFLHQCSLQHARISALQTRGNRTCARPPRPDLGTALPNGRASTSNEAAGFRLQHIGLYGFDRDSMHFVQHSAKLAGSGFGAAQHGARES